MLKNVAERGNHVESKWLIVGNDTYDSELIKDVPEVRRSVDMLEASVRRAYNGNVTIVRKENLTIAEFFDSIDQFFSEISDNTIPFFYFCGHGYRREDSLYLAAKDSVPNWIKNSSVEFSLITDCIKTHHVKHSTIILDCCYSGTANGLAIDDDNFSPILQEADYPNIVCLTSCKGVERAYFKELKNYSLASFTYHLALILKKGIDNKSHWMSIGEIYNAIEKKIDAQSPTIRATGGFDAKQIIPNIRYNIVDKTSLAQGRTTNTLKVLLVKSSICYPIKDDGDFGVPLGLWLLKSYIQRTTTNIVVDIFDERLRKLQRQTESFEECAKDYDVIGTSMCSCEVPPSLEKMRIAKEMGKITIAGGIFTYSNEEYLLSYPFVDFVVPGVGTLPLAKLLNELRKRKDHSDLNMLAKHINEDGFDCFGLQNVFSKHTLDDAVMWETASMPHIELDIWDEIIRQYGPYIHGKIDIYSSRGCNKACSFCSVQRETKRNVIVCDSDHVIRSIKYLYKKGIRIFSIKDEDFFLHGKSRVREILERFRDYNDISFKIRARIDTMLESNVSVEELARYHICEVQYGVESPEDELRKQVQKGIGKSYEDVKNLFFSHYKYGIVVNASFILGLPGESVSYYTALINFIKEIYTPDKTKIYLNFYTPHPAKCRIPENVVLISNDLAYFTHKIPVCYSKGLPPKIHVRKKMLSTYDEITQLTSSQIFNPTIPDTIRAKFISDFRLEDNEIMKYGEDN